MCVAWRDPFCIVSDDLATHDTAGPRSLGRPKMKPLSQGLALGLAGPGDELDKIIAALQPFLAEGRWARLVDETWGIVESINHGIDLVERMVTVVIAGTLGEQTGIFDAGPRATRAGISGDRLDRRWAFAGSGGIYAHVAQEIAFRWRPKVVGEELLRLIADVATDTDKDSAKPIWRIDLGNDAIEPAYKWLE
jgi:hypothetical protein